MTCENFLQGVLAGPPLINIFRDLLVDMSLRDFLKQGVGDRDRSINGILGHTFDELLVLGGDHSNSSAHLQRIYHRLIPKDLQASTPTKLVTLGRGD